MLDILSRHKTIFHVTKEVSQYAVLYMHGVYLAIIIVVS